MNLKIGDPSDARHLRLLENELGAAIPKNLWPSLIELMELEHSRGVRDAIASLRQFRKQREGLYGSLRDLASLGKIASRARPVSLLSWNIHGQDEKLFEDDLLRTGRIPKGRPGRPRQDQQLGKIVRLVAEGKSWSQIARTVQKTRDACRQHYRRHIRKLELEISQILAETERLKKEAGG